MLDCNILLVVSSHSVSVLVNFCVASCIFYYLNLTFLNFSLLRFQSAWHFPFRENIYARNCCRLNDVKSSIVDFLTYCHVKPQSAKVCRSSFCTFVQIWSYVQYSTIKDTFLVHSYNKNDCSLHGHYLTTPRYTSLNKFSVVLRKKPSNVKVSSELAANSMHGLLQRKTFVWLYWMYSLSGVVWWWLWPRGKASVKGLTWPEHCCVKVLDKRVMFAVSIT